MERHHTSDHKEAIALVSTNSQDNFNHKEHEMSSTKVHTHKEVNLLYGSSLMTGIIIGSGIFVSPVSIVRHCGSLGLSLVIWLASGVLSLAEALCYAEIGTLLPYSGAEVVWYQYVLGRLPAFLYAWMVSVIINPAFYALLGLTASIYLLQPLFPDCSPPGGAICLVSIWIIGTYLPFSTF